MSEKCPVCDKVLSVEPLFPVSTGCDRDGTETYEFTLEQNVYHCVNNDCPAHRLKEITESDLALARATAERDERVAIVPNKTSILKVADELCIAMKAKATLRADRHGLECEINPESADWYWMRLIEEVGELANTLRQPKIDLINAAEECADIGNFAACLHAVFTRSNRVTGPHEGMPNLVTSATRALRDATEGAK